jgi:20S proteasome subunit beta 6
VSLGSLCHRARRCRRCRTTLAICGDDFAVIAVDTRLAEDYHILSRDVSRSVELSSQCVLATGGCHTDVCTLHKVIDMRVKE